MYINTYQHIHVDVYAWKETRVPEHDGSLGRERERASECVCVCAREKERGGGRERVRVWVRESVCVCVRERESKWEREGTSLYGVFHEQSSTSESLKPSSSWFRVYGLRPKV